VLAAALGAGATMLPAADAAAVGPVTREAEAIAPVTRLAQRAHTRAVERHVTLHRTNARLRGARPDADRRQELHDWSLDHLAEANAALKRKNRRLRRRAGADRAVATPPHLQAIAACESGGNPTAVDASGTYRGKYQFDLGTWASVGGSGDPAAASEAEQDRRAAALYARAGASPWPVCGS
jgi:hypothetical protein